MVIQMAPSATRIEFLYYYFMSATGRPKRECVMCKQVLFKTCKQAKLAQTFGGLFFFSLQGMKYLQWCDSNFRDVEHVEPLI